jgi:hypothetical protein
VVHDARRPAVQAQAQGMSSSTRWLANALSKMTNGSSETSRPAPNNMA